jgi:GT2 family glycosyltransferase
MQRESQVQSVAESSSEGATPYEFVTASAPCRAGTIDPIDVSVVAVNYNTAELLPEMRRCLLAAAGNLNIQMIVIDNASRDDSRLVLARDFADARVILNSSNVGFGRANNQALSYITGRYVLLLNTDAFVATDTLRQTVAYMDENPSCGILGTRLVGRDHGLQPSCRHFPNPWNVFLHRAGVARFFPKVQMVDEPIGDIAEPRECDWVPGCYMLVRKNVIDQCGLFDPRYFLYVEEVDFCRRVKSAGWKVVYFPQTSVVHIGGESAKSEAELSTSGQISNLQIESELLYYRKHFGVAAVVSHVCLSWTADATQALRWVFRGGAARGLRPILEHAIATGSLFFKTRLGSIPTR